MALVLANDLPVLEGSKITIPRIGAWHADLMIDKETALTGKVTLNIGDSQLVMVGTVATGGAFVEMARARVVGGAGGLGKTASPKHYSATTLGTVLGHLLATAGEKLSNTASQALLDTPLEHWTTIALPIGRVIARLMSSAAPSAGWRILPDGTFWVGTETWPDSGLREEDYEVVHQADDQEFARIGIEVPRLLPGTSLVGRHVSYVEYQIGPGVRMEAWFGDGEHDRFKAAIIGAVKGAVPDIEYRVFYEATVDHQLDNVVDVDPGPGLLPTMAKVPVRCGPGMTLSGLTGGTVLVGWAGGDPSKPRAFAFDPEGSAGELVINLATIFIGAKAGAQATILGDTFLPALYAILDIVVPAAAATLPPSEAAALTTAYAAFKAGSYKTTRARVT